MGVDLLEIPVFENTIKRLHNILATKGLDLMHIITTEDEKIFEDVLNCCVGIGAIQIGLVNILREFELNADFLIGMSFGEIAAGYADGCLSERQAILSAYFRGYSVNRELTIEGRIALIGLGREQLKTLIPEDCDDAAHLDENTSTIAGPKDSIEKFADVLQKQNHFVWVANASNVPFHTRYLKNAGKELLKNLDNIIQEAKLRSKNWYSTSVVQEEWSKAQLCSGSYYVHNLLGCVYFEETCKVLPPNCVIIGIAPMCFLRTSMKTNTPDSLYIPLVDKEASNCKTMLLEALEKVAENGVNLNIEKVKKMMADYDSNNNCM